MKISSQTKIAVLLKHNPASIDAIVAMNNRFEKLKNPILRKLMAGRTSIAQAAKIGNVPVENFLAALTPLGFEVDESVTWEEAGDAKKEKPAILRSLSPDAIVQLDVRPVLAERNDPLQLILKHVRNLQPGQVLLLINSFEPTPLIALLAKKGYAAYTEWVNELVVHTWFYENAVVNKSSAEPAPALAQAGDWDEILTRFDNRITYIDVRALEMPMPMHRILDALKQLTPGHVLYVYHKRVPVYLIDELKTQQYDYRFKEIQAGEVHLLIWKRSEP